MGLLKALQRPTYGFTGRLFSRMHLLGQSLIEPDSRFPALVLGNVDGFTETNCCPTEWSGRGLAIAQANWDDRNLYTTALRQARQADKALMQVDGLVLSLNPSFRKHHQLLTISQKIDRQSQRRQGWTSLVHRKATQPLQKPPLQPRHLRCRDHEAAIPSGDPSPCCHRKHQRIPASAMGRCQQHRP